jgi:hypothetical protein
LCLLLLLLLGLPNTSCMNATATVQKLCSSRDIAC